MARQTIVWTALPHGRITEGPYAGRFRISLVASPRLVPDKPTEQHLGAFEALLHWPETVRNLRFGLRIAGKELPLEPLALPQDDTWQRLFDAGTPVSGFQFKDMSQVNLRSFAVRNVLGFARRHYGRLAVTSAGQHPTLLPYAKDGPLGGMLSALGTGIDPRSGALAPGFDRFHPSYVHGKDVVATGSADRLTERRVFGTESCIRGPAVGIDGTSSGQAFAVRALPPDWEPTDHVFGGPGGAERQAVMAQFSTADEYSFYQADRFYRRSTPTPDALRMRRPDFKDAEPAVQTPTFDFHRIVASYGDHPALMRMLGLVIDCVLPAGTPLDAASDAQPLDGRMLPLLKGRDDALQHVCLQTAWQATDQRFVAAARSSDHQRGLLALAGADDRHEPVDPIKRNGPAFDVYQVDPDGTALKTVDYLLTAQNLIGKSLAPGADGLVTYTTGDAQPVAALRSAGLGVSRHGRAGAVAIDAHAAALKNAAIETSAAAAAGVVLHTEDVLRGYRIDVQHVESGNWLSLCQRTGQYRVLRDGRPLDLSEPDRASRDKSHYDEGYVKSASTTSNGKDDNHYLHESLFRWAGWSLVAPRPGRALVAENDAGMQTERVASPGDDADLPAVAEQGNGLDVRFVPRKGSLPKLRFGEWYRFRARIVDLAGNSLSFDAPDLGKEEQATEPVQFARFEPVGPPALVLAERLSEGESLERMVIRSNFDAAADNYIGQWSRYYTPAPDGLGLADFAYPAVGIRHVVPPKAAQSLCEQHGTFDAALGSGNAQAIKQAYAVAARESGSLMDARPDAEVELVTPQNKRAVATVEGAGALIAPPDQADASRDRFAAGQYIVHREPLVPIPYLPDPAAGGIALHGVPGLARMLHGAAIETLAPGLDGVVLERGVRAVRVRIGDPALIDIDQPEEKFRWVLLIDFDTDPSPGDAGWPDDRQSLRIALHDQPDEVGSPACGPEATLADAPKFDAGSRTLHLFLPQGRIARLQYASFVHDQYVSHLGLPQWVEHPGAADQVRAAAMAGAHWMVTPFRRLVLVHATQQPVCAPVLMWAYSGRQFGSTSVTLLGKDANVALHGPSTGQFEVLAEWSEWVDDPGRDDPQFPGPRRVRFEGALGEIRLAENHANVFTIDSAVAAQRRIDTVAGNTTPEQMEQRANAPGNKHEFGDTRFRRVRYRLRAGTRFREYLPPSLLEKPDNLRRDGPPLDQSRLRVVAHSGGIEGDPGAALLRDDNLPDSEAWGLVVPASAAPDAPRIVYTLPTFRWTRSGVAGDADHTSLREGGALRVYLDRPWFSSGDGEMLAVIVAPMVRNTAKPFSDIDPNLTDRVTQWGLDPLWDSRLPSADAEPADFPLRVAEENVTLPKGGGNVLAVAHRVAWSDDRQLWYCDIEISAGTSYMPFVRLALARYQPNAMLDARLSAIVLADFAQVLPRRRAVLSRQGDRITARLHGPVPTRGPMRNRFREGGPADSPYANAPFDKPAGMTVEMGDNRVELVLQRRDPAIDSDLAWSDAGVLASGPAQPRAGLVLSPRLLSGVVEGNAVESESDIDAMQENGIAAAETGAVQVALKSGRSLRFDRAEPMTRGGRTAAAAAAAAASASQAAAQTTRAGELLDRPWKFDKIPVPKPFPFPRPLPQIDPAFWEQSAALPADAKGPTARLVLREFERYYSDRSVPEMRISLGTNPHRRRIVEERLVYTEFFNL